MTKTNTDCPDCGSTNIELNEGQALEHYRPGGRSDVCTTRGYGRRTDALLTRLGHDLTVDDFRDLALASADQAGASADAQRQIARLIP